MKNNYERKVCRFAALLERAAAEWSLHRAVHARSDSRRGRSNHGVQGVRAGRAKGGGGVRELQPNRFYGRTYAYGTPNDGTREIGVAHGLGDDYIVAWITDRGSRRRVKTHHLPPMTDPEALQAKLDAWAAPRNLAPGTAADAPGRTCRVCGCTDNDCRGCMQRTGRACAWVAEDLCSACAPESVWLVRIKRGNTNIATCRIGHKTFRASSTNSDQVAAEAVAEKAALALGAETAVIEKLHVRSIVAARASLRITIHLPGCDMNCILDGACKGVSPEDAAYSVRNGTCDDANRAYRRLQEKRQRTVGSLPRSAIGKGGAA